MSALRVCRECGGEHRRRRVHHCDRCEERRKPYFALRDAASALVSAAVRAGHLASPVGQACKDCGAAATRYDHRDYLKPFDVDPVCARCNKVRGPAIQYAAFAGAKQ